VNSIKPEEPIVSQRIPELDALRGLAAAGVLALHTSPRLFFWAWSCVDLFFVLSGYLITRILLLNAGAPGMLLAFYVRRALRIWPVYYLTLVAAVLIFLCAGKLETGTWPSLPDGQWLSLVFLQNVERYLVSGPDLQYIWYFSHSWSLAVEEQFYLLWPLVFFFLRPRLPMLCLSCMLMLAMAVWTRGHGAFFYLLATRIDGLLFGMLIAYVVSDPKGLLYRIPARYIAYAAVAGLSLVAPYLIAGFSYGLASDFSSRALEVAAFCLLFAALVITVVRWSGAPWLLALRAKSLIHLGRISFAVYMYHLPIGYLTLLARHHQLLSKGSAHLLMWVGSLLAAHFSYVLIERHALALKARFPYRQSAEVASPV
jgi:peptidoglycan/LPS O-acetylase OafA/YrhL